MTPVLPPPHFRSSLSPLFLLPSKNIELTEGHPPLCCDRMLLKCLFATSLLPPVRAAGPWWEEKLNQCGEVAAVLLRLQTRGNERDEKKRSDKMFLVRRSRVLRLCFHLPLRLVVWRPTMGGILRVKHPGGVLQGKEIKDEWAQTQNRITDARLDY